MSGSILKQKREELGLDIKEISALLKIKLEYLSAIEDDLFDKLPAPVYTIGYIRSYSGYLKVDPEDIISLYSKQLPPPKTDATIMPVILDDDRKKPKKLYIAAALLAIAAGLFVYFKMPYLVTDRKLAGDKVEAPRNNGAIPAKAEKKQDGQKPHADKPVPATVADSKAQEDIKPVPSAPADTKTSAPAVASGDQVLHRLSIKAVDLSWLSVKFRNGKYEEVTLKPGETKEWSFLEGASLKAGNAGGIQVMLDGKDLGPVGTKGQVVVLTLPPASAPAY